jgi:hypothetical protein
VPSCIYIVLYFRQKQLILTGNHSSHQRWTPSLERIFITLSKRQYLQQAGHISMHPTKSLIDLRQVCLSFLTHCNTLLAYSKVLRKVIYEYYLRPPLAAFHDRQRILPEWGEDLAEEIPEPLEILSEFESSNLSLRSDVRQEENRLGLPQQLSAVSTNENATAFSTCTLIPQACNT